MKRAFAAWIWSLGVVARSYLSVIVLAALIALWAFAAYEWLGLPAESSALLLILSLVWAILQLLAAAVIVGGTLTGCVEVATANGGSFPLTSLWTKGRKKLLPALAFCLLSLALVWVCGAAFDRINSHSVEVASFLTYHSEKPVSHMRIEQIYDVIERLLWVVISGFLLSFLIAYLRAGGRETRAQTGKLLAGCTFRIPFLTSLLSVLVFGGIAFELANWHPVAPPGFWDYTQLILRFAIVIILISGGVLFWALSLAHLQRTAQEPPHI
jgi:hypothetical protein